MEQEFQELQLEIEKVLANEKQKIFQQLNDFLYQYKTSFYNFQSYYNNIFSLVLNFKYMINPNNLSAKLMCDTPTESMSTFNKIKQALKYAKQVNSDWMKHGDSINNSIDYLNSYIDNLPNYQAGQILPLQEKIEASILDHLKTHLKIKEFKLLHLNGQYLERKGTKKIFVQEDELKLLSPHMIDNAQNGFKKSKTQQIANIIENNLIANNSSSLLESPTDNNNSFSEGISNQFKPPSLVSSKNMANIINNNSNQNTALQRKYSENKSRHSPAHHLQHKGDVKIKIVQNKI